MDGLVVVDCTDHEVEEGEGEAAEEEEDKEVGGTRGGGGAGDGEETTKMRARGRRVHGFPECVSKERTDVFVRRASILPFPHCFLVPAFSLSLALCLSCSLSPSRYLVVLYSFLPLLPALPSW
eukprot:GHVU01015636.1.p1 GENE.GHVU01015636.1~~GHVU01015636.1.p1  ORF type:complete len:123 (-),score=15.33 GHVU01015636.1:155-523(-)